MGRKRYKKILKAQTALDAIKDQKTIAELASEYGVHANQISIWKKQLHLMPLLLLLATEKIKMLRKKRLSEIICIKKWAN